MESLDLALDLFGRGQLSRSLTHFQVALEKYPLDLHGRVAYVKVLAHLEDWELLLSCLESGLELHAQEPEKLCVLSWQLYANGYVRRARLRLESALQRHPEHPRILQELGRIAYHQLLWESALGYWQRSGHLGLSSLALEKLRRRGEAYHCWLRFLESGQDLAPELDSFRPSGYNLWNFALRYDSLLLGHSVSDLRFHGEEWYFQAREQEAANILRDFLTCARVAGWPITRVEAAELEDTAIATILAEELSVPCGPYRGSLDNEFVLLFSRSADRLPSLQIPKGLTFALTSHGLGPLRGDAPDITGVAHTRRVSFGGLSGERVRSALEATPRKVFDDWRFRGVLRPVLQLRPGWEGRAATLPPPSEEELCRRIRAGDRDALDWLPDGQVSRALKEACEDALEVVDPEWVEPFLRPMMGDESAAWDAFPGFRRQLYWLSQNAQALTGRAILSSEPQLREVAIRRAFAEKWQLQEDALRTLDLTCSTEATLWLRQQDREKLRDLVKPTTHTTLLLATLDFLDESFAAEVCSLLDHAEARIREKASGCLADWGQLSKRDLLALCETRYRVRALRALARNHPDLAIEVAVSNSVFDFLREIGSPQGLPRCRALLHKSDGPCRLLVRYLHEVGEPEEEMLETALATDPFPAARALIERGDSRYWEVFRLGLESSEYDECAKELLDWGTTEALDTLVLRDRNPEAILHELPHHHLSDRVREMIPVAWRRLREVRVNRQAQAFRASRAW